MAWRQVDGVGVVAATSIRHDWRIIMRVVVMTVAMRMTVARMDVGPRVVLSLLCQRRKSVRMGHRRQLTGDESQQHGDGYKQAKHPNSSVRRTLQKANRRIPRILNSVLRYKVTKDIQGDSLCRHFASVNSPNWQT